MARLRCRMGELCGESHGVFVAHWEEVSEKEMNKIDKEMEKMTEPQEPLMLHEIRPGKDPMLETYQRWVKEAAERGDSPTRIKMFELRAEGYSWGDAIRMTKEWAKGWE